MNAAKLVARGGQAAAAVRMNALAPLETMPHQEYIAMRSTDTPGSSWWAIRGGVVTVPAGCAIDSSRQTGLSNVNRPS